MFSLTALLASLPPASLAETDLARFCAVALGRRTKADLPGLRALLAEETLRGYPPSLGPILLGVVEQLVARAIDPQGLDARTADRILGAAAFIATLEQRIPLAFRRQRMRPGTLITPALRATLGERLITLPGVGPEVVLVAPVELAHVADARFTMPLGPALGKPAGADEAEALRTAWGAIEEAVGLQGPDAERWLARFSAVSRRENHDATTARAGLSGVAPDARVALWDTIVGHLRDQELPEQHRPGRRGLERRLAFLGLELELPWVQAVVTLCESAYRAAGPDAETAEGRPPCTREDVEVWQAWVDVPAAGRERVGALEPALIERLLVVIAELEAGRLDAPFDEALRRPLTSLRDLVLRPRWARSRWALAGRDPLLLAQTRIASGEDARVIRQALEALADEARRAPQRAVPLTLPAIAPPVASATPTPAGDPELEPTRASLPQVDATKPGGAAGVEPASAAVAPARPRFELPPMPAPPPPRPRPRTRPRTDFPPMPSGPLPAPPPPPVAAPVAPPRPREPAQRPRTSPAAAAAPSLMSPQGPPAREAPPRRTSTAPHLVTPAQGNEFYDQSFRELEVIERDLVQRGPFASAAERVESIAREAAHLHAALGPSSRSGDRDFMAALARIEKVQAYLERLRPLVRGERPAAPASGAGPDGLAADKPRGLLGRLFGRRGGG